MTEFVQHHEFVVMFLLCSAVGLIVWHYERWRDRQALDQEHRFIWQCVMWQGGASVWTPGPMTEAEAIEFIAPLGAVAYVDKHHHKIFYRARGH